MPNRACDHCSTIYPAEQRYLNRNQGQFCSRRCSGLARQAGRTVPESNTECSWCGIAFYRTISHKHSKSGLYFCCVEHQNNAAGVKYSPGPKRSKEPQYCVDCNRQHQGIFSRCISCNKAHRVSLWLSGDISVTWMGPNREPHRFVKRYLLETRGDKCESCGFDKHGPFGSIIQMDHIDGNYQNNLLSNLRLLCPNCHATTPTYGSRNKGGGRGHRRKVKV